MKEEEQLIIAGPCAMETPEQVRASISGLVDVQQQVGHKIAMRETDFKPRTESGVFDGMRFLQALPLWVEASKEMPIATEVTSTLKALLVFATVKSFNPDAEFVFWGGSRLQSHKLHQGLGRLPVAFPDSVRVLVKNQPWRDQKHLNGIGSHLKAHNPMGKGIYVVNRGFHSQLPPGLDTPENRKLVNPHCFRNVPDHDAFRNFRQTTGVATMLDPSHQGGTRENVLIALADGALQKFNGEPLYSGLIIEAHPDPQNAWTDAMQQLQIGKPLVDAINFWLETTERS